MTPVDPPLRVGPAIAPVGAVGPAIVLDGRLSPQSLSLGQVVGARLLSDPADGRLVAMLDGRWKCCCPAAHAVATWCD
jgi:hypothetical protein